MFPADRHGRDSSLEEMLDHDGLAARLDARVPHWQPDKAHGYHSLTIGTMVEELTRQEAWSQ